MAIVLAIVLLHSIDVLSILLYVVHIFMQMCSHHLYKWFLILSTVFKKSIDRALHHPVRLGRRLPISHASHSFTPRPLIQFPSILLSFL